MAESIKNQIDALTGFGSTEDLALQDWCEAAVKEIINILPPALKEKCSQISALTDGNGLDVDGFGEIQHVTRETADSSTIYAPCRRIPSMYGGMSEDSSSLMYYGTATDPVYWIESDSSDASRLFIKPNPSGTQDAKIYHIGHPQVNIASSEIGSFPDEAGYLVVLYASVKALQRLMNNKSSSLPSDVSNLVLSTTSLSLPTFTAPSNISLPSVPVKPSLTSVAYSDASAPSKPDISGDVPTYTKPSVVIPSAPSISALNITSVPPSPPSAPSFSSISIGAETVTDVTISGSVSPTYTAPTIVGSGGTATNLTGMTDSGWGDEPDFDFDDENIDFRTWFQLAGHYIQNEEDVELGAAQLQKIQTMISAYQTEMQSNLNDFNAENTRYQSEIQENIQQAQINAQKYHKDAQLARDEEVQDANIKLQKENLEYASKLQKYSAEVGAYQAKVNSEIQEWRNSFEEKIQVYQQEGALALQKYSQDIQNQLNVFNKENTRYQANIQAELSKHQSDLQVAITNADKNMQKIIQDNNSLLSKYSTETAAYQAEVASKVQEFQTSLQKNLETFGADLNKYNSEINKVNSENQSKIGKFTQDLNNYTSKMKKISIDYQWLQTQQVKLQQDYNQGIQLLIGGGRPPRQRQGER